MKATIPTHSHLVADGYAGGYRLHHYGRAGDQFTFITQAEADALQRGTRPVITLSDGFDCPLCNA